MRRGLLAVLVLALAATDAAAQTDERLVVRRLEFRGNEAVTDQVLANSIVTTNSSFFARVIPFRWLGFLGEKRYFNEQTFTQDVVRLEILYKLKGYPGVEIDTTLRRTPQSVYITFTIEEGLPVVVDSLQVAGADALPAEDRENLLVDLPLQAGDVFDRLLMRATADTLTRRLRNRGYPSAEVFTSFATRAADRTARVQFDLEPGEPAVIGAVRVEGDDRIDSTTVVNLLAAQPGTEFSLDDLFESQRNLYNSELFRFATVGVDSGAFEPGADSVPLVVRVNEAPTYRVGGGLGYGTSDCFRGTAGVSIRDFLGGGRILELSTRLSKVGVGEPMDWNLENGICQSLVEDSIGSRELNYNVTVAFRKPAFLSPNNTITYSVFVEKRSEFKVFLREEVGGRVSIARETPRLRIPLSLTYTLSHGRTEATAASFCAFFQTCDPEDIALLTRDRRLALLSGNIGLPRANNPLDPTRGYIASLELAHASEAIGSSEFEQFSRAVGEVAWYRPLARDVVLSWRVKGGMIFAPEVQLGATRGVFIPPDQRFYGGGPNDVRGYERNALGPVVYVTEDSVLAEAGGDPDALEDDEVSVVATGGNTLAVGNIELRLPSPIFRDQLRLAAFLDVGGVWQRGGVAGRPILIRATPGVGLRVATPLGPARLDIAYNPYMLPTGTLYATEPDGDLRIVTDRYDPERGRGLTLHFAVGQPF